MDNNAIRAINQTLKKALGPRAMAAARRQHARGRFVTSLYDIWRENPASNPIGWTRSHRRQSDCCRAVRGRSDADLAGPRCEDMSYFFAGRPELDLPLALDILDRELGVKRLLFGGRRAVPTVPFCGPD